MTNFGDFFHIKVVWLCERFSTKIMTITSFRAKLTDRSFSSLLTFININYYYYLFFVFRVSCTVCCRMRVLRKATALKNQISQRIFSYNLIESFLNLKNNTALVMLVLCSHSLNVSLIVGRFK